MAQEKPAVIILQKLLAIRKDVQYIQKEGRNSAQGYRFLSERQITELFKELLDKHGVLFSYSSSIHSIQPTPKGTQLLTNVDVEFRFIDAETGEWLSGKAAGAGTDPGDKGVYKAITGAIKYIFMKTFLIPTGDDPEDDSREPEGKKAAKKAKLAYGTSMGDETDKPPFGPGSDDED